MGSKSGAGLFNKSYTKETFFGIFKKYLIDKSLSTSYTYDKIFNTPEKLSKSNTTTNHWDNFAVFNNLISRYGLKSIPAQIFQGYYSFLYIVMKYYEDPNHDQEFNDDIILSFVNSYYNISKSLVSKRRDESYENKMVFKNNKQDDLANRITNWLLVDQRNQEWFKKIVFSGILIERIPDKLTKSQIAFISVDDFSYYYKDFGFFTLDRFKFIIKNIIQAAKSCAKITNIELTDIKQIYVTSKDLVGYNSGIFMMIDAKTGIRIPVNSRTMPVQNNRSVQPAYAQPAYAQPVYVPSSSSINFDIDDAIDICSVIIGIGSFFFGGKPIKKDKAKPKTVPRKKKAVSR